MSNPVRLAKKPVVENRYEAWILNHAHIFVPMLVIIACILIGMLVVTLFGTGFATEANMYYYHMGEL